MASKKPTKRVAKNEVPEGDLSVRLERAEFKGREVLLTCTLFRYPMGKKAVREGRFTVTVPRGA